MDLDFKGGSEILTVRILGKNVYFMKIINGMPTIQELSRVLYHMTKTKLSKESILNKYPELEGKSDEEITNEGAERLKADIDKMNDIIKGMSSQQEVQNYVTKELESIGLKLFRVTKPGFRAKLIKEDLNGK